MIGAADAEAENACATGSVRPASFVAEIAPVPAPLAVKVNVALTFGTPAAKVTVLGVNVPTNSDVPPLMAGKTWTVLASVPAADTVNTADAVPTTDVDGPLMA